MKSAVHSIVGAALVIAIDCALLFTTGCDKSDSVSGTASGSGSGGGVIGVYTAVDAAEIRIEFRSGGTVVMSMGDEQGKPGTYTIDGEKIIVDIGGQKTTFIRDGNCIEDAQHMFGKMCKGGKAGAAANASTRTPPPTVGTWAASNADGEFTIEFKPGNKFTITMKPSAAIPNAKPAAHEAKFIIEGDTLYATFDDSTPMVLKWVNNAYESNAFGPPMKFVKK